MHLGDYRETPFEVFLELSQQNCYWCGAPPGNKSVISNSAYSAKRIEDIRNNPFIYNGLDRLDNNRDHSVDNIVPCCKRCNFAKNNRSCQEYDEWIIRSYNHRNMRQVDFEFGSGI